ncbi:MAG: hypothetical protein Q9187_009385, partial [Circinaria calcarea]
MKKEERMEDYLKDNDIQLLKQDLDYILKGRSINDITITGPSEEERTLGQDKIEQLENNMESKFDHIMSILEDLSSKSNYQRKETLDQSPSIRPIKLSYAQAATSLIKPSDTVRKIFPTAPIRKPAQKEQNEQVDYKARRLILQNSKQEDSSFNPKEIRDQINERFHKENNNNKPVIATVSKSQMGQNIILTTTADFNAAYLQEKEQIWKSLFKYSNSVKDKSWYK